MPCYSHISNDTLGNDNIVPLKVDVTKDDDTVNAASAVSKWLKEPNAKLPRKLHAVVNNAGIAICGLVDWVEMSSYQKVMDSESKPF